MDPAAGEWGIVPSGMHCVSTIPLLHLWNIALTEIEQSEDEWSFQSLDDGG